MVVSKFLTIKLILIFAFFWILYLITIKVNRQNSQNNDFWVIRQQTVKDCNLWKREKNEICFKITWVRCLGRVSSYSAVRGNSKPRIFSELWTCSWETGETKTDGIYAKQSIGGKRSAKTENPEDLQRVQEFSRIS